MAAGFPLWVVPSPASRTPIHRPAARRQMDYLQSFGESFDNLMVRASVSFDALIDSVALEDSDETQMAPEPEEVRKRLVTPEGAISDHDMGTQMRIMQESFNRRAESLAQLEDTLAREAEVAQSFRKDSTLLREKVDNAQYGCSCTVL